MPEQKFQRNPKSMFFQCEQRRCCKKATIIGKEKAMNSSAATLLLVIYSLCVLQTEARRFSACENLRQRAELLLENSNYLAIGGRRGVPTKSDELILQCRYAASIQEPIETGNSKRSNKFWPPWPLSLLERTSRAQGDDEIVTAANTYPSAAALFWVYMKQRTKIGVRQCREIGATLYFHLPPALPPFILLASIPRKIISDAPEGEISKRVVPLVSNSFARNLALSGLGLAVMSWAHSEMNRKRKLTPIVTHQSVSRVFLPPFLPEPEAEPEIDALESAQKAVESNDEKAIDINESHDNLLSPKLRKHLSDLSVIAPRPQSFKSFFIEWKRARLIRRREAAKVHRNTIFDELVALQAIKRKSAHNKRNRQKKDSGTAGLSEAKSDGYALVTGASAGIGRAIAVELARWEIPLILVARDTDSLISLAYDLEACYGVKCCVLQADLSKRDAAEKIHQTTSESGIAVDILVNNAGIAHEGLAINMAPTDMERLIMLNTMTYSKLACLYGQDMMKRKRGRILMVSSMAGLASSAPNIALYGATKAFGKSLALSMAREMEKFGVGVTCLLPGAVNTRFRDRSGLAKALCWYLPFYARSPDSVAHLGVTSLLDGDTQVIPGIQNRLFEKIARPLLPLRIESMVIEAAFSPLRLPRVLRFRRKEMGAKVTESEEVEQYEPSKLSEVHRDLNPRYKLQPLPRLLKLPSTEADTLPIDTEPIESSDDEIEGDETKETSTPPTADVSEPQLPSSPELIKGGGHIAAPESTCNEDHTDNIMTTIGNEKGIFPQGLSPRLCPRNLMEKESENAFQ